MKILTSISISAPIEKVFGWLVNDAKTQQWMIGLAKREYIGGDNGKISAGRKFRQIMREGRQTAQYNGEVLEFRKPEVYAVRLNGKIFTLDVWYRLHRDGTDTRLEYETTIAYTGGWRFIGFVFEPFTRNIIRKQMKMLKSLAE